MKIQSILVAVAGLFWQRAVAVAFWIQIPQMR